MGEIINRLEIIKPTASMRVLLSKCVLRLAARGYAERTRSIKFSRRKGYLVRRRDADSHEKQELPISRLKWGPMCPDCENRQVTVVFEPPSNAQVGVKGAG